MITEKVFAIADEARLDLLLSILNTIHDTELLEAAYVALKNAGIAEDWYERLDEDEKVAIRQSRKELATGNVVVHEDLMSEMMAWTKR